MKEMRGHGYFFVILILLIIAVIVVSMQKTDINITSDGQGTDKSTISASGRAEINVDPDEAYVMLTVETTAKSAEDAQSDNAEITSDVMDALDDEGVNDDEIETTGYYLYPQQKWDRDTEEYITTGYKQTHTIKVTITKLDKAGEIVDAAVDSGVNRIGNIEFTLSEELREEKYAEALEKASKEAKARAESIAGSLDVKIVKISRVAESSVSYTPRYYGFEDMAMAKAESGGEPTQISPEDVTVSASVSVEYYVE